MQELETDVLIVGGGLGGCAAAHALRGTGVKVIMTEESDWIGGQLTSQATPPDEHGWIEHFGCTASYRGLRNAVREHYKKHYPLTEEASGERFLNPGNGWVSPLCAEPRVFLHVLQNMLRGADGNDLRKILTRHYPVSAVVSGDRIQAVQFRDLESGRGVVVSAKYFIDATELGELLPLTGAEFVTGSESSRDTGEPSAPDIADPSNSQAFSLCFALSFDENADNTISRPAEYDFWRNFVPQLTPSWSGPLLSLDGINPRTLKRIRYNFAPHWESGKAFSGLWTYRRIRDRENFQPGSWGSDVTIVNYPQIDYFLKDLSSVSSYEEKQQEVARAKQLSLSFLYWLQTEAGFPGLKLEPDVVGTADGLAKMPYVRESRRIKAEFTVTEQQLSAACRLGEKLAESYLDSVGIGYYRIDLHPTVGGDNYLDVEALPFQIPLGALIPARLENLVAGAKNIGTTHITNGCYRVHPVEWNIGEAAGALAAFSLENGVPPRAVRDKPELLAAFQRTLEARGVELNWPAGIDLSDGDPHSHAQ